MNKLERLLKLLAALLDTTIPLAAEDLRRRIGGYPDRDESFRRAFERDKDDLRQSGITILVKPVPDTEPAIDGYLIDQEEYAGRDPGLDADELAALHLAAALVRVEEMGDDALWKLGGRPSDGTQADGTGVQVEASAETDTAGLLHNAIRERRTATFEYDNGEERILDPARLSFTRGRWYISGFDRCRDDDRVFRLDRITSGIDVGSPGAFEARSTRGPQVTRIWELGDEEPLDCTVRIEAAMAASARIQLNTDEIGEQADGSIIATLTVRNSEMFRDWVLEFYDNAVVLGPPEIRQMMIDWIDATVAP